MLEYSCMFIFMMMSELNSFHHDHHRRGHDRVVLFKLDYHIFSRACTQLKRIESFWWWWVSVEGREEEN